MSDNQFSVLVVDDIGRERAHIKRLVKRHPAVDRCVEARNGYEALELILQDNFTVLFLDIKMPGLNGIEVAWKLKELPEERRPLVVLATAYDEYAVEGHRLNVTHYITKPFNEKDVHESIQRALDDIRQNNNQQRWEDFWTHLSANNTRLPGLWAVSEDNISETLILFNEICWIHIENKQLFVNSLSEDTLRQYRLRYKSLKEIEADLPEYQFARVSQSHIVNIRFIAGKDTYGRNSGRGIALFMKDPNKTSIPIGSTYVKSLKGLIL